MVDFSLRKTRNYWKGSNSSSKQNSEVSLKNAEKKKPVTNPYANLTVPNAANLPTLDAKERNKAASSMQRRLSIHTANYTAPNLDYSMPLPSSNLIDQAMGDEQPTGKVPAINVDDEYGQRNGHSRSATPTDNETSRRPETLRPPELNRKRLGGSGSSAPSGSSRMTMVAPLNPLSPYANLFHPASLRKILSDPQFSAKKFIHERLSEASAVDIDSFTSNLTELSTDVQEEVKRNIYKSYNEIITVNNDLHEASAELKQLRSSISELTKVTDQFVTVAKSRIQMDEQQKMLHTQRPSSPQKTQSSSSLPPVSSDINGTNPKRDRTSVMILEKMWDTQLATLYKNVEGAQKHLGPASNRHSLIESSDWTELNISTQKPLQTVQLYILNDAVLVAGKTKNKQHELIVSQCCPIRDVTISTDREYRTKLMFNFGNSNTCLYETRDINECMRVLDAFRKAKDDLRDITENEKENSKRIKESSVYLQNTQQTPGREGSKSPAKRRSMGSSPSSASRPLSASMDQFILQNLSISVHSRSKSHDWSSLSHKFKLVDNLIEEVDIDLARLKFDSAVNTLLEAESQLATMKDPTKEEDAIILNVLTLKLDQRRDDILTKVTQRNLFINEIAHSREGVKTLIRLGLPEAGSDLLLQNKSNLIQELLLQVGSSEHPSLYLTELAIVRFQIIKRTVIVFRELFHRDHDKLSSILVSWCSHEVEKHFNSVSKQLSNGDKLSPDAIRYSRKQIDDLKTVGSDFVYKLDEFIKNNINKSG